MDYQSFIFRFYPADDPLRRLLLGHSRAVADRCLRIAAAHPELGLDREFLEEAAMLHDIGIRYCHAPSILCTGEEPYLRHGYIGGRLLRAEGYERHARVCERHTGTGLHPGATTALPQELLAQGFFVPETLEEQAVCYADKFYSKSHPTRILTVAQAAASLERFGKEGVATFLEWAARFE